MGAKETILFGLVFIRIDNKSKYCDKKSGKGCYFCKEKGEGSFINQITLPHE
ncbi:hypothetical protein F030043B2_17980 [Bacteroides fragilis]